MPEMTEELAEMSVKPLEEPGISLKKIAEFEDDLEEMKKGKDAEMSRRIAKIAQIEANLKVAKLEADLVDGRERNRELERKIAEAKRKNDDLEAQLSDSNTEVRDGKAKIGELEGKINLLQGKNSGLKTQIQFERENKTAEIAKLRSDLNRTMNLLDLYQDGWSYLAKTASWYKVVEQEMTFDQAVADCASRKGHLVSIHSQEENNFVRKLAKTVEPKYPIWIGLKRNPNEGNAFEWTDGSLVDFTNWAFGEPSLDTHVLLWTDNGKWGVDLPTTPYSFICKRSSQF